MFRSLRGKPVIEAAEIPKRLKMARVGADLSRVQAAQALNVNERTLSSWETGRTMIPFDKALALCDLYQLNIGELSGDLDYQLRLQDLNHANARLEELLEELRRR
jgi:transcriptional regulator with XRE-family HTH domain